MTLAKILSISLCMGVGSLAFATDPTPPAATTATAPATPDAPSTNSADQAKTATTTAKTATAPDSVTKAQAKAFRSAGYKAEVRNGTTYYCRDEVQIGTRFDKKVCGTADDLLRLTTNSQETVSTIQRTAIAPAPGKGN